jgi:Ca2+-binding RTX toxin-like protein
MGDFTGTAGNDVLTGTDDADQLDGLAGNDTMKGGKGADAYAVDSTKDQVIEAANGGIDSVFSNAASFTLGVNVENLTLFGFGLANGTGNTLGNRIDGNGADNKLDGGAGNDTLTGGGGFDTLIGGTGNDSLDGGTAPDLLSGGAGDDVLTDNFGGDTLTGGIGNDIYSVQSVTTIIEEAVNAGIDEVKANGIGFSLVDLKTVENLTLLGATNTNGTGNALANRITGNAGVNLLTGNEGNDTLDGGAGADVMFGGLGNDIYIVDDKDDAAIEGFGGGTKDKVLSSITFTLSDDVEELILTGDGNIRGTGNDIANVVTGNGNSNDLDGGKGNDTLTGGAGDDELTGGLGKDVLIGGQENDVYSVDDAGDKLVELAGQGRDRVESSLKSFTLGVNFEDLELKDGALNGTGNTLENEITGNAAGNKLDGGAGDDDIEGGLGNDTLLGGSGNDNLEGEGGSDIVDGGAGNDELDGDDGSDTILGGAGDDNLEGEEGFDLVDGGAGRDIIFDPFGGDTLRGGAGNDQYSIGFSDSNDTEIVEALNGGIDFIRVRDASFSLANIANVENLTLDGTGTNGTGNDLSNRIIGNAGINGLDGGKGNDTLDGGVGADILTGGLGNDTYMVDDAKDQVIEEANGGKDAIFASVGFKLLAAQQIESLTLTGSAAINASGNELNNLLTGNASDNILNGEVGNDTLTGGDGNDLLFGDIGNDVMTGGKGDDRYFVDSVADKVSEAANQGIDTVNSNVANFVLGANFENLQLGNDAINGTGNSLDNTIDGSGVANKLDGAGGDDEIDGDGGADTLIGGAGNDDLDGEGGFDLVDGGTGNDTLTDLSGGDTLKGGAGNDHYVVASFATQITELANAGIDEIETVDIGFSLVGLTQVENLTLTGVGQLNGTGNDLSNVIIGNDEANILKGLEGNDLLNGGKDADTLIGSIGNDVYIVDNGGDDVFELENGGKDTVFSSVGFSLVGQQVEVLTFTGTDNINGIGNELDNVITGNTGVNTLRGNDGNDTLIAVDNTLGSGDILFGGSGNDSLKGTDGKDLLDGETGNDSMSGGKGDDRYEVDSIGDKIVESANAGRDEVTSLLAKFTLGANLEDLTLVGGALDGTGNSLGNEITGNAIVNRLDGGAGNDGLFGADGNDILLGGAGNDSLKGGLGRDTLSGGAGKDLFIYDLDDPNDLVSLGPDVITDFAKGVDKIDLRDLLQDFGIDAADAFANGHIVLTQDGNDGVILFSGKGGGNVLPELAQVTGVILNESDFLL